MYSVMMMKKTMSADGVVSEALSPGRPDRVLADRGDLHPGGVREGVRDAVGLGDVLGRLGLDSNDPFAVGVDGRLHLRAVVDAELHQHVVGGLGGEGLGRHLPHATTPEVD
ncbi:MAG: hypothetical protein R2698_13585 [Microthrixaceae bacterium]